MLAVMRMEWILICATALCWGGYPLVARAAGYGGARGTLILMLTGLVPIVLAAAFLDPSPPPGRSALGLLTVAGLMMGAGLLAFYALANSPMDASVSIPIVDVAMLIVSALGAILFFSEPATMRKVAGIALMLAGIALLRPE